MIKKMTQYLLQRRCALSLLLMLMLLQPVMAQAQTRQMYARLDRETHTLTLYYDSNFRVGEDQIIDQRPLWQTTAERKKIKTVVFDESFKDARPTDCGGWFWWFEALTTIEHLDYLNTSEVDDMLLMFSSCTSLETLDLSSFNTEKVTTMATMFEKSKNLHSIKLPKGFIGSSVTNLNATFRGCESLTELDLSGSNTENVKDMNEMFDGCSNLESLDLSHFNTRNVLYTGLNYMFNGCSSLSSLDVSNFTTDKPRMQLDGLFKGCSSLQTLDLSSFSTGLASSVTDMFDGCSALRTIYVSDLFTFNNGVSSTNMFRNCDNLKGAIDFISQNKDSKYANYESGYLTKKVGTNGNKIIGATGSPLNINKLVLDDSKAYTLYEDCNVTSASYARAMKSEWGTLCLPFTIDPTSEANTCNFYTLQNIGNESVVLELIENGTVEAGQPVVIRKKDNTQTNILINNVENTQVVKEPKNTNTGNRMMGTFTNMELADDCYFIANNQFRLVSNYKPAASGVKLAAFRAYIQPQKTNVKHAPSLNISVNDKTTGIENTNVLDLLNDKEAEYYDVNGRRIQNLQKGINIVKKGNKTMKIVCR